MSLPTWDEMSDLDKGAVLLYLAKADSDGIGYARDHYPARYFDHPALTALGKRAACAHAEAMFTCGIDDAYDELGQAEADRLYDLADARR